MVVTNAKAVALVSPPIELARWDMLTRYALIATDTCGSRNSLLHVYALH